MLYGLLLPGGIGGDGFKVFYLKKAYRHSYKKLTGIILLDRLSGGVALIFLAMLFTGLVCILIDELLIAMFILLFTLLLYPAAFFVTRWFLKSYTPVFNVTSGYSLSIQSIQVASAFCLLIAFGINNAPNHFEYLSLFLLSSIFTFIPITIGGAGARELVFIVAANHTSINQEKAVAFSVLFFSIGIVSSLIGVFVQLKKESIIHVQKPFNY